MPRPSVSGAMLESDIEDGIDVRNLVGNDVAKIFDSEVRSVAGKIGKRAGVSSEIAETMKSFERENRQLRHANEIPCKASAYCR